jgi:hypothetical protein
MTGIVAHQIITRKSETPHKSHSAAFAYTPISDVSLPDADFPDKVTGLKTFYDASVRLKALFDSDGTVKEVALFPMLPYAVPESAAGNGEFLDHTPFMSQGKFVKELPFGLAETAIDQIQHTYFTPATYGGRPVSQWVMINVYFSYNENRFASGCSTIDVTIMDDMGVRWTGNTWVNRHRDCVLI